MFGPRYRLQEAALDDKGGGGGDWLKPFGEHAKAFEGVKDHADLATRWTALNSELATLKAAPPADWRKALAGNDDAANTLLARYADAPAFMKAHNEAVGKVRSGELAKPLPKDATPEQIKAWREGNGIPLEPKGYFEKLPEGLVIGKDDQPVFDAYAKVWHDHNLPPAAAHAMTKLYYDALTKQASDERALDTQDAVKTTDDLRKLWGPDYEPSMQILKNWLQGLGGDLAQRFQDAILPDGKRLLNDIDAVKWLVGQARLVNPMAGLLPAGGEGDVKNLHDEIAKIEKMMGDRNSEYFKGPKVPGTNRTVMEDRFLKLVEARGNLPKK